MRLIAEYLTLLLAVIFSIVALVSGDEYTLIHTLGFGCTALLYILISQSLRIDRRLKELSDKK